MKYEIINTETKERQTVSLEWILDEINRDRSDDWKPYDKTDWKEGLNEMTEYIFVREIMKILIACEESQSVCKEFRKLGHEAYSCDILPCSGGHPEWHLQQDITPILEQDWDMIIAFPPCTHLAVSGAPHFAKKIADGRQQQGIDFFMLFANCKCDKVVIENPIGIMSTKWKKPNQIIQPWQFGDEFQKSTCLWIRGLPLLEPTKIVGKGEFKEWIDKKSGKKKRQAMWFFEALTKSKTPQERSMIRSKTFPGIAEAMAEQWGSLPCTNENNENDRVTTYNLNNTKVKE